MRRVLMMVLASSVWGAGPALGAEQWEEERAELAWGFHGGIRSWGDAPFAFDTDHRAHGLAGAEGTYEVTPFSDTPVAGLYGELRYVGPPLRVIGGYRVTFPDWGALEPTTVKPLTGGRKRAVATGGHAQEFRLGFGYEPPIGPVTPFVDLLGDVTVVRAQVAFDGEPSDVRSTHFSLVPRAGVRIWLDKAGLSYLELAGEHAVFGPGGTAGHFGLGFSFD